MIVQSFGLVAVENKTDPATLAVNGVPLEQLDKEQFITILQGGISAGVMRRYESEQPFAERSRDNVYALVLERVVQPKIVGSWGLIESLFGRAAIEAQVAQEHPKAQVVFRSWLRPELPHPAPGQRAGTGRRAHGGPGLAVDDPDHPAGGLPDRGRRGDLPGGIRRATPGCTRIIQTNITNLAGRAFDHLRHVGAGDLRAHVGAADQRHVVRRGRSDHGQRPHDPLGRADAGAADPAAADHQQPGGDPRGAALAAPGQSYGVGATKWQTIWHHVLPSALPGILTGNILAISRAIGETAPLVVVGASTFIVMDPNGPFAKFTTLPIQIYQWTARPQAEFRNIAAAAILVLLVMLLSLNAAAVLLRNRYTRR